MRNGDLTQPHACITTNDSENDCPPQPHVGVYSGTGSTVFIEGRPAQMVGDKIQCPDGMVDYAAGGSSSVLSG